jgi:hypothetical protein
VPQVTALTNPSLLTGGKAGIQSAVATLKTNLDEVASTVQSRYKPQVDAAKSALSELEKAVGKLGNGSVTSNLQTVGTAIADVGTTAAPDFEPASRASFWWRMNVDSKAPPDRLTGGDVGANSC